MPRHRNRARFQDQLYQIQKIMPKKSRRMRRHQTVYGEILPSFIELVFRQLSAIRIRANHWQLVERKPECQTSSRKPLMTLFAKAQTVPTSKQESQVMMPPVVVSAWRLKLYPGDFDAFSPLQQSLYIHTSGKYSSNLLLHLSLTSLRILVEILLPAQVPLILLIYPLSSRLILLNFLIDGMTICTCPPPQGRQPLLMIFIDSQLSTLQWFFRKGMSWVWITSIELSPGWLVKPCRWMLRAVLPMTPISSRYSKQYEMPRSNPHSKCSSTPSLLVIIPAQNFKSEPPLVTMILQPFDTASTNCKNLDSSGLRPGGLLLRLISSRMMFCSATSAQKMCCLKLLGFFLTSIEC